MGHRNKFNKATPSKGQKLVAKLEFIIEQDLKDAITHFPIIDILIKHLASLTNRKSAINLTIIHLAECYVKKKSPTSDNTLIKDQRILSIIKRDVIESYRDQNSQNMLQMFILSIDELIVQVSNEKPEKGRFSKVLEDYLLAETLKGLEYSIDKLKQLNTLLKTKIHSKSPPVEEDDDLILIYDADD